MRRGILIFTPVAGGVLPAVVLGAAPVVQTFGGSTAVVRAVEDYCWGV